MANARFLLAFLPTLVGCATTSSSDVGQVREVAPGTYAIAVASNASLKKTLFQSHEGTDEAVSQAAQFCHAKGQKLVIMPGGGKDITFQCGEKITPGE
jgi:hypothetical protein